MQLVVSLVPACLPYCLVEHTGTTIVVANTIQVNGKCNNSGNINEIATTQSFDERNDQGT